MTAARRPPLLCYDSLAFMLSGAALVVVGLPSLHDAAHKPVASLVAFPIMVVGVGIIGIALTALTHGSSGIRELRSRLTRPVKGRWFVVLALRPIAILAVLVGLQTAVSATYAPGFLIFGFAAGAFAGFFEELGWTGFAYPRMRDRFGSLAGALLLGLLWALWHFPVVDSRGAASPHGRYWPVFFAAFVAMIMALRVLIAWVYVNTGSLRMAQLLHASSTGFLVVLGGPRPARRPSGISPTPPSCGWSWSWWSRCRGAPCAAGCRPDGGAGPPYPRLPGRDRTGEGGRRPSSRRGPHPARLGLGRKATLHRNGLPAPRSA